jgi:hypothetical protein
MRVIITGDRSWHCPELAKRVVGRLVARYGKKDLVIVHSAESGGVGSAFDGAAIDARVTKDPHPADTWLGEWAVLKRNRYMIAKGADLCVAVHKSLAKSKSTKHCVRQTIAAGIPTWLIDSEDGEPRRLTADDPRLD